MRRPDRFFRSVMLGLAVLVAALAILTACGVLPRTVVTPKPAIGTPSPTPSITYAPEPTPSPSPEPAAAASEDEAEPEATPSPEPTPTYILNKSSKRFHRPTCASVEEMKPKNRAEFFGTREEAMEKGYVPCGRCKP